MITKIQISGSDFSDTDLEHNVCSHLKQILNILEENGAAWHKTTPNHQQRWGAQPEIKRKNKL